MTRRIRITSLAAAAGIALARVAAAGESFNQPAKPAAPPTPVTLPADPRIASATPEMRGLLEDRKRVAMRICVGENDQSRPEPAYQCDCYGDRVVIATLDANSTIYRVGPTSTVKRDPVLTPVIEIIVPRADLHTCFVPSALPKRAYEVGTQFAGAVTGDDAKKRLAQCIADGTMAAHKAKPAQNI